MEEKESSHIEGNWFQIPRSGNTRLTQNIALDCVTVDPVTLNPYFFIFSDIDSKDTEVLRKVLQQLCRKKLSAYFWETAKGYNVCSPCLLTCREWSDIAYNLKRYQTYSFSNLRWSHRATDSKIVNFEDYNKSYERQESLTLHQLVASRFNVEPFYRGIKTKLTFSFYNQLLFRRSPLWSAFGFFGRK